MKRKLFTSLLSLMLVFGAFAQTEHEVYFDDGDDAIADAIDAAAAGDVILLMSPGSEGHYINTFEIYGDDHLATGATPKGITIKADPELDEMPVIEGSANGDAFYKPHAELNIIGVELMNFGYCISVKLTADDAPFDINVDNCFIHDLTAGAIYISSSTLATINSLSVTNTVISNQPQRNAIYLRKPKGKGYDGQSFNKAKIENCLIFDAPYAMYIEAPTDGTIPEVIVNHVTVDRCGYGILSKIPGGIVTNSVIYGFDDENPGTAFSLIGTDDNPTVISDVIYTGALSFTDVVNATNVEAQV